MNEILFKIDEAGQGGFYLMEEEEVIAEMVIGISGSSLTVYHTEVFPKAEGKGMAKKLLIAMVEYARKNKLNVIPLCPFVHAQFKRHPEEYADLWIEGKKI